jgi:hypothetical protein
LLGRDAVERRCEAADVSRTGLHGAGIRRALDRRCLPFGMPGATGVRASIRFRGAQLSDNDIVGVSACRRARPVATGDVITA